MRNLVIGRGMLGQAVMRRLDSDACHPASPISWQRPHEARRQLSDIGTSFGSSIDGPWRVVWSAGAGVVGTSVRQFVDEQSYLETLLTTLRTSVPVDLRASGGVFFASSAGGVFGCGSSDWLTEDSVVSPISPYGESKLLQEQIISEWAAETSVPVMVGRLSNLYGAGQNLDKSQGFISQLLRSMLVRSPFRLGVSGDTERDFIHVDDAAARINVWLLSPGGGGVSRKLIAAGQSRTLSAVAHLVHAVTRIQPRIMYAEVTGSVLQPRHLRFASRVRTDLDALAPCRPLEVGISETWHAMLRTFAAGEFA